MTLSATRITAVTPRGALPSASFTITGSGFGVTPGTVVFDPLGVNLTATVSSWVDDTIVATVPVSAPTNRVLTLNVANHNGVDSAHVPFWVADPTPGTNGLDYQYPATEQGDPNTDDPYAFEARDFNRLLDLVRVGSGGGGTAYPVAPSGGTYTTAADDPTSVAVGDTAHAFGTHDVAVGFGSTTSGYGGDTLVGWGTSGSSDTTAIGAGAGGYAGCVVGGVNANASESHGVVLGWHSEGHQSDVVVVGAGSIISAGYGYGTVAVGGRIITDAVGAVFVGFEAAGAAGLQGGVVIGQNTYLGALGVAVGDYARVNDGASYAIAIGYNPYADGPGSITIGSLFPFGSYVIDIGQAGEAGVGFDSTTTDIVAIGNSVNAQPGAGGPARLVAIGYVPNIQYATSSIAIGDQPWAQFGVNLIAIGYHAHALADDFATMLNSAIAIGDGSVAGGDNTLGLLVDSSTP